MMSESGKMMSYEEFQARQRQKKIIADHRKRIQLKQLQRDMNASLQDMRSGLRGRPYGTFTMGGRTFENTGGSWYEIEDGEKTKNFPAPTPPPRPARKRSTLLTEVFGTGNHPLRR